MRARGGRERAAAQGPRQGAPDGPGEALRGAHPLREAARQTVRARTGDRGGAPAQARRREARARGARVEEARGAGGDGRARGPRGVPALPRAARGRPVRGGRGARRRRGLPRQGARAQVRPPRAVLPALREARAREGAGRDGRVPLRELRRRPLGGELLPPRHTRRRGVEDVRGREEHAPGHLQPRRGAAEAGAREAARDRPEGGLRAGRRDELAQRRRERLGVGVHRGQRGRLPSRGSTSPTGTRATRSSPCGRSAWSTSGATRSRRRTRTRRAGSAAPSPRRSSPC